MPTDTRCGDTLCECCYPENIEEPEGCLKIIPVSKEETMLAMMTSLYLCIHIEANGNTHIKGKICLKNGKSGFDKEDFVFIRSNNGRDPDNITMSESSIDIVKYVAAYRTRKKLSV